MAARISKLERDHVLLLKFIEAQFSAPKKLDAAKTASEWPAIAGPAPSARIVSERLRSIGQEAIAKGLVERIALPCSSYGTPKKKRAGEQGPSEPSPKKRARDAEEDVMDMTDEELSKNKKVKTETVTPKSDHGGPRSSNRNKSHLALRAPFTPGSLFEPHKRPKIAQPAAYGAQASEDTLGSDSDSDSLADLEDTPTKADKNKQRTLPERRSRAVRKYYDEDDDNKAGELEESDGDFDPFRVRQEWEKQEARKQRSRRFAGDYDSD